MDQNQNNTNVNLNNNQAPVGGMNFVTGEGSIPQKNVVNQPVMEQPNVAIPSPMVNNVQPQQVASQPIVNQPVENNNSVEQAMNNNIVSQQNVQSVQTMNTVPAQEQPITNMVPNVEPVNTPSVSVQEQPVVNQSINVQPVQGVNELNNLPPVQTNVDPNNMNNYNSNVDETKSPKKINPILAVLLVIVLSAAGVALGFFLFNKFGNKGENEPVEQDVVDDNTPVTLSENTINNTNVDSPKLNEVLTALGIASTNSLANNNILNYYLSVENYKDNAKDIIVYASINTEGKTSSEIELPEGYDLKSDVGACSDSVGCALISKEDAEKVMKLYNLGDDLTKYYYKSSEIDDVYGIHYSGSLVLAQFNGTDAGIKHNLVAEIANENAIKISDNQVITYYDDLGSVQTKNLNVTYLFKSSNTGSYYLDNVSVSD